MWTTLKRERERERGVIKKGNSDLLLVTYYQRVSHD